MKTVLIPLPNTDFDPTESAVPWHYLREAGHQVVFATPDGQRARADDRMISGQGLGIWKPTLIADANGQAAYRRLDDSAEFSRPIRYDELRAVQFDAILLPGGHAPGMKPYLESTALQALIAEFDARRAPIGAICHGVLLVARSKTATGNSVLHGKRTTALTAQLELTAWAMTCAWLGSYYRTYPKTVQREVTEQLAAKTDFIAGPFAARRDAPDALNIGFTVRDQHYLSARWPGDAHRFGSEFCAML